jgi:ABC-2 type transport system ATP-binding protein
MNELLHFSGVGKTYANFELDGIDFELPAGKILGLIGANGAGKSTTLRILLGLVRQDRGRVEVFGLPMPKREVAVKREAGYVAEDLRLHEGQTLGWHMKFVAGLYPGWDESYAGELLRRFELDQEKKIRALSADQRIKSNLLLAFAHRPRLLVLDEPTLGLDPLARQEVRRAVMEAPLDERRTAIFSSQNTFDVEQIADRILFLDRGRVIGGGDKESFVGRWRRLRLDIPPGTPLPPLPGSVASGGGGLSILTTGSYDENLPAACREAGATVLAVEKMTLDEIFVASVERRRKEKCDETGTAGLSRESLSL